MGLLQPVNPREKVAFMIAFACVYKTVQIFFMPGATTCPEASDVSVTSAKGPASLSVCEGFTRRSYGKLMARRQLKTPER